MSSFPQISGHRHGFPIVGEELHVLFYKHSKTSTANGVGRCVVPGAALPDIIREFCQNHHSLVLLDKNGQDTLINFTAANVQIEVTLDALTEFIEQLVALSSKDHSSSADGHQEKRTMPHNGDTERTECGCYNRSLSSTCNRDSLGICANRSSPEYCATPPKSPMMDRPFDIPKRPPSLYLQRRAPSVGLRDYTSSDSEARITCRPIMTHIVANAGLAFYFFPARDLLSSRWCASPHPTTPQFSFLEPVRARQFRR